MNLELKHLAAYLPYKLKMISNTDGRGAYISTEKRRLKKVEVLTSDLLELFLFLKRKPILRPLSDLTKEIEMNGERFVPIEKIAIYGNNKGYLEEAILTGLVEVIVFNMLLSWHFDAFGLIEAGLAIDINTLTT